MDDASLPSVGTMAADMTQLVQHAISSWGLVAIFILMAAGSCGIPAASEAVMPAGGLLAATGRLSLPGVMVAGIAGTVVGSLIAFLLTRRFGEPLLLGPGRYVGISPRHVEHARKWFAKWGNVTVLIGRDIPVLRTYISFPAGLGSMRVGTFLGLTLVGATPWCVGLAWIGYAIGTAGAGFEKLLSVVGILVAVVAVALVLRWWWGGRGSRRDAKVTPNSAA